MIRNCYCCENVITASNESVEHILPNAIGGKLKSSTLLCMKCNSKFGESFDSELTSQLLFLSSFLNIKRDRGEYPALKGGKTPSGEEIHMLAGGKPYYSKPIVNAVNSNNELTLSIRARSKTELRTILKGLNKKYPQINVEEILTNTTEQSAYLQEPVIIRQTIGGKLALNAIVKIALNYSIYSIKDFNPFKNVIQTLKDEVDNEFCKHYYPGGIYQKEPGEICHVIHVQSDKRNKNVIVYVEFFSTFSFIVLLCDNYNGKKIKSTYCYDLKRNKTLEKNINLKCSTEDFKKLPVISPDYYPLITEKMDRVVQIGLKEQNEKALSDLVAKCVDDILKIKYGHEPIINRQMIRELSEHVSTEFVKFAYRNSRFD